MECSLIRIGSRAIAVIFSLEKTRVGKSVFKWKAGSFSRANLGALVIPNPKASFYPDAAGHPGGRSDTLGYPNRKTFPPMNPTSIPQNSALEKALCVLTLFISLAAIPAHAVDLIKADNTTELGTAGSYTSGAAVPTASDTVVFDNTLVTSSTFSWANSRTVLGVRLVNPSNAVTVNLSGSTYNLNNNAGNVTAIDLSSATKNLTFATASSSALLQVRGSSSSGGAFVSVGNGATLTIQSNFNYTNGTGTPTIRLTGAGNFTVNGTNGKISDKTAVTALTAFSLDNSFSGTATFSNANTYSGGTSISGGTLVAGNAGALGGGAATISGGTLDLNGASALNLALASGKGFTMSSGTLNITLGTSSDQITSAGSAGFSLSGGTLALTLGTGFDYNTDYQLFGGFDGGLSSVSGLAITGYDTVNFAASLSTAGLLEFTALSPVPEPSSLGLIMAGVAVAAVVSRRRLNRV
jgi:autotransporter-associated beta strand protein